MAINKTDSSSLFHNRTTNQHEGVFISNADNKAVLSDVTVFGVLFFTWPFFSDITM